MAQIDTTDGFATRRGVILSGAAGLLAAGAPLPATAASAAPLVDLMPAFWRAWDNSRALAADTVPAALIARFFEPHADLYAGAGVKVDETRVGKWVARVSPLIPAIRRQSAGFRAGFDLHVRHFTETFPDFDARAAPIYLMPSLGQFDGHLQAWGKQIPLFIGADGLVLYHGENPNLAVLLDHESFHLYQDQKNPGLNDEGDSPVYITLWKEGLATYVSSVMNPSAPRLSVLLDDKGLDAADDELVRRVAGELVGRLDSRETDDYRRYFSYGHKSDLPARTGYLVGLLVAKAASRGRTLAQMARLDRAEVRAGVEAQLRAIRDGASNRA
jgi:hypothetical protein